MQTALALVHHANQFLITEGYDNREGLATVLGSRSAGHGLAHVLEIHRRHQAPLNLHLSGTLLEAIAWHAPEFLDQVREMHKEGLIDFVGSCYGQNIMRFFDSEYNRRQINEELLLYQLHLGIDPATMRVFWPPERVWETSRMAPALRDAALANNGYRYVLIDDRNLVRARDEFDDETARWNAELYAMHEIDNGLGLNALPIATSLRRSIPPREKDEWERVRNELESLLVHANLQPGFEPLAIYADDMEKVSGIWGQDRISQYENFLQWVAESNWLRCVKLSEWAAVNQPLSKRSVLTGTFAELSKEFEAGEGYEKWFYSDGWAPYRQQFRWSQQRVKEAKQAGADASLIELAEKHLLVSAWETAWHTPSSGAHGDPNPENNSQPSPWAAAIASHSRHAAVIAEAALWMSRHEGVPHAFRQDIDDDGDEEVILTNGRLFAVITPRWGGRVVALFSISHERGVMMVGNPSDDWNFLADLNRFMEVPRNHPGCFTDVAHENDPFEVVDLSAVEAAASVKLMGANGIEKLFTLSGDDLTCRYRVPKRLRGLEIDFGLSPDYLSLLRAGSAAMVSKTSGRVRGCSTSGLGIEVEAPEAGVEFTTPSQPTFGHGCLLRVATDASEFEDPAWRAKGSSGSTFGGCMILDQTAENPSFSEGRVPDQIDEMVEWLRDRMGTPISTEWRVISARRKFGKELLEIEETGPAGSMRMIAKTGKPHRIRLNHDALVLLWNAGFQPPAELTVPKPVAYFPERDLLVQEKAPGVDLLTKIREGSCGQSAAASAARWLAAVHGSGVPFEEWETDARLLPAATDELSRTVARHHALDVTRIAAKAQAILQSGKTELVPAHGDFHPLNIFIADSGRITGIDVDKFGGRDRSEEVAYAMAQIACIGHHRMGNFESSLPCRKAFFAGYEDAYKDRLDRYRLGAYMAITIVKNLHFELVACQTGRTELLDPWLAAASECLEGDLEIRDSYR